MVVTTCESELVVMRVLEGVRVLVVVSVDASELVLSSELVGVRVEVVVMTVTEAEEDVGGGVAEDVGVLASEVVSTELVADEVTLLVWLAVREDVAEFVEARVEPEAPVLRLTL